MQGCATTRKGSHLPKTTASRNHLAVIFLYCFVAAVVAIRVYADSLVAGGDAAANTFMNVYRSVSGADSTPSPSPSPSQILPGLVMMSDNRGLEPNLTTAILNGDYVSLTTAVNFLYSRAHNYSFEYILISFNLTKARALGINMTSMKLSGDGAGYVNFVQNVLTEAYRPKDRATCYHPGMQILRAASWSKLVTSWLVSNRRYEWVAYLDSDCIFVDHDVSIDSYTYVQSVKRKHIPSWGAPVKNASVFFMANSPWLGNYPVAGFYWWRPGAFARRFFQYWWDVNDPGTVIYGVPCIVKQTRGTITAATCTGHAFKHGFEQESLWNWMTHFRGKLG
jgi:hypothetical protein